MADEPVLSPEEMARQLRSSIQQERPRRTRALLMIFLLVAAPLALLAWLLWPRPELPRLNIIAFDQVTQTDQKAPLEAWLIPRDPGVPGGDLRALEVIFDALPAESGGPVWQVKALSESSGRIKAWSPSLVAVQEIKVSHAASRLRYHTEDRARLFVWKNETPGLVVDVTAVAAAGPDAWRANRFRDIAAREAAGKALQAAQTKGYQILYVAAGAATPTEYRLMRAWVEARSQDAGTFPEGPVLGRIPGPGATPAARDWVEYLAPLVLHRRGVMAVTRDPQLAAVLRDTGAKTFVLTDAAEVPPNTTRLPTWADLPSRLADDSPRRGARN